MNLLRKLRLPVCALAVLFLTAEQGFADPLIYRGNERQDLQRSSATSDASSPLIPVGYSTSYETEYNPNSSFLQSPYPGTGYGRGGVERAYSGGAVPEGSDPYAANEVSPYSKYSPYMEIIGEGSDYTLGVDDVVTIIVRDQPDFSGRFVVDPYGNIQYNFLGDIKAEGRTKEELKAEIAEKLKEYVRFPEVAVMISEYRSKNIYVFGFVNHPGKFAMKGNKITVKEAIVAAGLPRVDGSLKRVYVIRPSEFREEANAAKKQVNLKKLIEKGDSAEDFMLQPGDTLIVHQRYFDRFVNAFSRVVGPMFQAAAVYELGFGGKEGGFITGGKD